MSVRYIRIKINSNLKHSQASPRCISFDYSKTFGEAISEGTIVLKRTGAWGTDDNDYVSGKLVEVWMSDTLTTGEVVENSTNIVFRGYVTDPQFDAWRTVIKCADRLWLAKLQETGTTLGTNGIFKNQTVFTIWDAIIARVASQSSLSFTTTHTVGAPTPSSLDEYEAKNVNCYEKLWELANIVGWQFYYDPVNDVVVFEPKGTPTNQEFANKASYGAVWSGKTVNVIGLINWSSDSNDLTNNIRIIGGQSEVVVTNESHTVTGGTLTYTLSDTKAGSRNNNTQIYNVSIIGNPGSVTLVQGVDYVVYESASPPGFISFPVAPSSLGYSTIVFNYTYKLSVANGVNSTNPSSISTYLNRDKTITKSNIVSSSDITSYVSTLLAGFKDPFTEINFETIDTLIVPTVGAKVSVFDGVIGRQALYTDTPYPFIISTTKHWPSPTTSVRISTKPLKYEERDQNIYDKLNKVEKIQTLTNSQPFVKMDGTTPLQGDLYFGKKLDGSQSELKTPVIHKLATAPTALTPGQMYFNTTDGKMYYRNNSAWVDMTGGTVGTGTQNRLTKWATTTTLGDSLLIDNGSNLAFKYASYSGTGAHISNDVNGTIVITVPAGQKVKFVAA